MTGQRDDEIRLRGLRIRGRHGVLPEEREQGQDFVIDLDLGLDLSLAGRSDDVADTVHYGELATRIAEIVAGEPVDLIETLAERIAAAVLEDRRVLRVRVEVHKPQAPIPVAFDDVSVSLVRSGSPLPDPVPVVLALGSNLGDREATLAAAVAALDAVPGIQVTGASPVIETAALTAHGVDAGKPAYLNQVVLAGTALPARDLLDVLLAIEQTHGRERTERWGDRTLDLDLIAYGGERIDEPDLRVPHPEAASRRFVLEPWLAVDPDAVLPGAGRVADLLAELP
jgi:dihydroneopterin aldolase/2-amino-4-hydroxy-6-hydroxymethyldihydropteridine diphosphokinase